MAEQEGLPFRPALVGIIGRLGSLFRDLRYIYAGMSRTCPTPQWDTIFEWYIAERRRRHGNTYEDGSLHTHDQQFITTDQVVMTPALLLPFAHEFENSIEERWVAGVVAQAVSSLDYSTVFGRVCERKARALWAVAMEHYDYLVVHSRSLEPHEDEAAKRKREKAELDQNRKDKLANKRRRFDARGTEPCQMIFPDTPSWVLRVRGKKPPKPQETQDPSKVGKQILLPFSAGKVFSMPEVLKGKRGFVQPNYSRPKPKAVSADELVAAAERAATAAIKKCGS